MLEVENVVELILILLGISVKDDERYEEDFIPIGKAYGGYTNDDLKHLNKRIKELVIDRFGSTLQLKPH